MNTNIEFNKAWRIVFLFLLLVSSVCFCMSRPINTKRLMQLNYSSYSMSHTGIEYGDYTTVYTYQQENPELISTVSTTSTGTGIIPYTASYIASIEYDNGIRHIRYCTSIGDTIDIYKDNQNRIIEYNDRHPMNSIFQRLRSYYNDNGRLDSLKLNYTGSNFTEYRIHYNDQVLDSISVSVEYDISPVLVMYPDSLQNTPNTYRIDEVLPYNFRLALWRVIFEQPYRISFFTQGHVGTPILYSEDGTTIEFWDCIDRQYILTFDADGYVVSYYTNRSEVEIDYNTAIYTWESITPNDDPVAPVPSNVLHVYPNPFRDNVKIEIQDASSSPSEIAIYNIKGQLVKKWDEMRDSEVHWDGKDMTNHNISSGVYLVKVKHNGTSQTSKIVKIQ